MVPEVAAEELRDCTKEVGPLFFLAFPLILLLPEAPVLLFAALDFCLVWAATGEGDTV